MTNEMHYKKIVILKMSFILNLFNSKQLRRVMIVRVIGSL